MCESSIRSIFVYGTLKRGHLRAAVWPRPPLAIRPATIRAALYDVGPYPAIGEGEDRVLGEVWTVAADDLQETLDVLDRVEGYVALGVDNEYNRIATQAEFEDGTFADVFTYRFADEARLKQLRRIAPHIEFAGRHCAGWPDASSRVPKSFEEE